MTTGTVTERPLHQPYSNVATFCQHGCRLTDTYAQDSFHRFIMLTPAPTSWSCDDQNRLILFRFPTNASLATPLRTSLSPLVKLPPEIHHLIADNLHPIDRVCVALTCKTLCLSILAAPPLTPSTWTRFTNSATHPLQNTIGNPTLPEFCSLTLRLAHGWVDKARYRYCWKCHRILTRSEGIWRDRFPESRPRIKIRFNLSLPWLAKSTHRPVSINDEWQRDKTVSRLRLPKWSIKTGLPRAAWEKLNRAQRYEHLIKLWCHASNEDSSGLYCDWCRKKNIIGQHDGMLDVEGGGVLHPVQCPNCLEKELTWAWRRRRKGDVRWQAGRIRKSVEWIGRGSRDAVFAVAEGWRRMLEWVGNGMRELWVWLGRGHARARGWWRQLTRSRGEESAC